MTPQDIPAIMDIEMESFAVPWSARAYDYEIHHNEMAHYYAVRLPAPGVSVVTQERPSRWRRLFGRADHEKSNGGELTGLIAYGGFWLMVDEAHISTVATHPQWRRRGIGELLLLAMIDAATEIGARWMTLEARVSSVAAQALYRKYGFDVTGTRRNYYSDNGEDALIMTTPPITTIEYQRQLEGLKDALFSRLSR